jgi:hypothetical protein
MPRFYEYKNKAGTVVVGELVKELTSTVSVIPLEADRRVYEGAWVSNYPALRQLAQDQEVQLHKGSIIREVVVLNDYDSSYYNLWFEGMSGIYTYTGDDKRYPLKALEGYMFYCPLTTIFVKRYVLFALCC